MKPMALPCEFYTVTPSGAPLSSDRHHSRLIGQLDIVGNNVAASDDAVFASMWNFFSSGRKLSL